MIKFIAIVLISLTALIRAYHLPQEFMFAEDQEDLTWRVKQIAVDKQLTLISGKFSQIGIYLPPGYLYFLLPFFLLTNFHPLGAMMTLIFLSALTALGMFYLGFSLGRLKTGFIAWLLYTFFPLLHTYDRIFWQPNLILVSSAFAALSITKLYQGKKLWLLLLAVAAGTSLQSHPQGIILTIVSFTIAIIIRRRFLSNFKIWAGAIAILFLSVSPLVLFELRHGLVITKAALNNLPQVWRPYYLLWLYPPLIAVISVIISRLKPIIFLLSIVWLVKFIQVIVSTPPRPDGILTKLANVNSTMDLIVSQKVPPHVKFTGNSEGYRYLFWYVAKQRNFKQPIIFYESWDKL